MQESLLEQISKVLESKLNLVSGSSSLESKLIDKKDLLLKAEKYLGENKVYIEYYLNQTNKIGLIYSYSAYNKKREVVDHNFYVSLPSGAIVLRVPKSSLEENVLGTAEIGTKVIRILDSLEGDEFLEVLYHEAMHLKYPNAQESEIRNMVSKTLPFKPKFHKGYYS